jgi:hypothetical protein
MGFSALKGGNRPWFVSNKHNLQKQMGLIWNASRMDWIVMVAKDYIIFQLWVYGKIKIISLVFSIIHNDGQ